MNEKLTAVESAEAEKNPAEEVAAVSVSAEASKVVEPAAGDPVAVDTGAPREKAPPPKQKLTAAEQRHVLAKMRHDPEAIRHAFETGAYPYKTKMKRPTYERHKAELQVELLKVQKWVEETNEKIVVLFEGRDAAGKGGTIKRFMEHLNPRGARVVARVWLALQIGRAHV